MSAAVEMNTSDQSVLTSSSKDHHSTDAVPSSHATSNGSTDSTSHTESKSGSSSSGTNGQPANSPSSPEEMIDNPSSSTGSGDSTNSNSTDTSEHDNVQSTNSNASNPVSSTTTTNGTQSKGTDSTSSVSSSTNPSSTTSSNPSTSENTSSTEQKTSDPDDPASGSASSPSSSSFSSSSSSSSSSSATTTTSSSSSSSSSKQQPDSTETKSTDSPSSSSSSSPTSSTVATAAPTLASSSSSSSTPKSIPGLDNRPSVPTVVAPPKSEMKSLPPLITTPESQQEQLLLQKIRLCCIQFDWSPEHINTDQRLRDIKREHLADLVDYIGASHPPLSETAATELIRMVACNFFRTLPPRQPEPAGEEADDAAFEDPEWPHLMLVYELFLRFILLGEVDAKTMKKSINAAFIVKLLELFDSQDMREREYLKTLLHRIYAKFMSLRSPIRKSINNVFFVFVYETEHFVGVAELLEILGSIINGFALPLKAEHKVFFNRVLTPMHKVRPFHEFHQQLTYCIAQFVDKDPALAVPFIQGLLKYWPTTCSSKEVLFLGELEEIVELVKVEQFVQVLRPLFTQIAKCLSSPHFQVAERTFYLWQNEYLSTLITEYRADIFPILYPALHANANHWNPNVVTLTQNLIKIFRDVDDSLVRQTIAQYGQQQGNTVASRATRDKSWDALKTQTATALTQFSNVDPQRDPADLLPPQVQPPTQ